MVYLKGIFIRAILLTVVLMIIIVINVEAGTTKIAYKKAINGKTNAIKSRKSNVKEAATKTKTTTTTPSTPTSSSSTSSSTITTTTSTPLMIIETTPNNVDNRIAQIPKSISSTENEEDKESHNSTTDEVSSKEHNNEDDDGDEEIVETVVAEPASAIDEEASTTISYFTTISSSSSSSNNDSTEEEEHVPIVDVPPTVDLILQATLPSSSSSTKATTPITVALKERPEPVPCTCGVFLTSQLKKGSSEQPLGTPVILNELDRNYPCTAVGMKQCQTKCLETIVQHLPNSANILCATLDRDCRKERAYLYIKNCRNQWWNTSLTAGREYCCKNGKPYTCPLL